MRDIIKVKNLEYKVPNKVIFSNVNLEIPKNKFTCIIGPNGAGKSTLVKCLIGILKASSGLINIKDRNILEYKNRELSKIIAYVPQQTNSNLDFTVEDIIMMGRMPYKSLFEEYNQQDKYKIDEMLKRFDLYDIKNQPVSTLSGGEMQKLIIARAVVQETEVIVLDEPLSNLDIKYQIEIMEFLKIQKQQGKTVIIVIHDLNLASKYADIIVLMNEGKIHQIGSKEVILTEKNIKKVFKIDVKINNTNGRINIVI